ncbi:Reticulocyte-binding protein 2-like protein a [Bienertia sinuspersici]
MESAKTPHVKKAKKKQVKDELDRMKQAEKKRRRLEKALATSAAIRSELEKKKQLKKEEQERLDEEGAAIAEAVALHVLLGEDSDDTRTIMLKNEDSFGNWHHATNFGFFMDKSSISQQNLKNCSFESVGLVPGSYGQECEWNHYGEMNQPLSLEQNLNFQLPYFEDGPWCHDDFSAGLIAAQAVSALQLGEDAHVDRVFFNQY